MKIGQHSHQTLFLPHGHFGQGTFFSVYLCKITVKVHMLIIGYANCIADIPQRCSYTKTDSQFGLLHAMPTHPKSRNVPNHVTDFMLKLLLNSQDLAKSKYIFFKVWLLLFLSSLFYFSIFAIACMCILNLINSSFFTGSGWNYSWPSKRP